MNELLRNLYNPPPVTIKIGHVYTITDRVPIGGKSFALKARRMRAVAEYKNVVLFEDDRGIRECWTRWELARCMT